MYSKFNIINPEAALKAFTDFECGKTYGIELKSKDFEITQEEMKPFPDFEPPVNSETGAKFPFCCKNHIEIFKAATDFYQKFPNCCEHHKKLLTANWFDKKNYAYVPEKVVNTIQYTFHCISKCFENDNWYNEITDYISETVKSYGHFPDGFGEPAGLKIYLPTIEHNIKVLKEIPENKRAKLIEFVKKISNPEISKKELPSLNILINKYQKWLKIFPFDLPFFSHLKPHFENQLPILKGEPITNLYTNRVAFKTRTEKELIEFLIELTESIITEINTLTLNKNGTITDIQKTTLDLLNENRNLELKELKLKPKDESQQYIKLLKKWFEGEKKYCNELKQILKDTPQKKETGNLIKVPTKSIATKSKLEFTKDKLRATVLELANLNGYENPSTYLDELLQDVEQFNDFEFKCNFFLNIHCLCKENIEKFWSEGHRKDISTWFKKAHFNPQKTIRVETLDNGKPNPINVDLFSTTWEPPQQIETKKIIKAPVIALFCFIINDAEIIKKDETESNETYSKRVCKTFDLTHTVRVSKGFWNSKNKRNLDKVKELILPKLNKEVNQKLTNYFNNKQQQKQKLYA
ncbi:MAG TPA: hypothetical protein VIJ75_18665 [Hanamia sp.]